MDLRELSEEIESISRRYADHIGVRRDDTWFVLKLQEEVGELTQAFLMLTGRARKKGRTEEELATALREELADVLCHVLLMARQHGVDLEEEVARKWLSRK
ncbi:pyrophosphatase [Nonomuraea sp. MG754425]|uniref:MazG nucleotide pyrophosphohydrolase domain-containing protein n=1 Tax=Nonomuraea sp. MG754425 TaxID=2570319 RepID=UPI001F238FCA|nr:MazG nucleotide pyrophosphohydrolase domain-containing protein [Nonomuraea sp. MG754425]MCF6468804.1 pyrophosphatase [Nonomuraea sp. MG754425]